MLLRGGDELCRPCGLRGIGEYDISCLTIVPATYLPIYLAKALSKTQDITPR